MYKSVSEHIFWICIAVQLHCGENGISTIPLNSAGLTDLIISKVKGFGNGNLLLDAMKPSVEWMEFYEAKNGRECSVLLIIHLFS